MTAQAREEVSHGQEGTQAQAQAAPEVLALSLRTPMPNELRWVQSTWSRCARVKPRHPFDAVPIGNPAALHLDERLFYRAHIRLVDELLASSIVIVATLLVDPDPIGWACYENGTLHYVYVAPAARRCSVATQLVLHAQCTSASHVTPEGVRLLRHLRATPTT